MLKLIPVISRQEAIKLGLNWFFTGVPCKHGHISKRQVRGGCMECSVIRGAKHYEENKESRLQKEKEKRLANHEEWKARRRELWANMSPERKEKIAAKKRAYQDAVLADPVKAEKHRKWYREYWHKNKHTPNMVASRKKYIDKNKEVINEKKRLWKKENRHKVSAQTRARQAGLNRATPFWVDREELNKIYKAMYDKQKSTKLKLNVDHFYPLNGKRVSGLNVPWNLQIITQEENLSKGSKMPEDFYTKGEFNDRLVRCGRYDA